MDPRPNDPKRNYVPTEQPLLQKVQVAVIEFVIWTSHNMEHMDDVMREVRLAKLRGVLDHAAAQGVESAVPWHTYATWSNEGPERIECFTRALDCLDKPDELTSDPPQRTDAWRKMNMRASCLFEIGRVHFHEGDLAIAQDFLLRALPLAQEAERLRAPAGVTHDDLLEGKIAELLVQLPD